MILTDIHCHILPGVDDGAPDMTVTKDMLDKMYDEGVRRIIATPHYRVGMFEPSIRSIQSSYLEVKKLCQDNRKIRHDGETRMRISQR